MNNPSIEPGRKPDQITIVSTEEVACDFGNSFEIRLTLSDGVIVSSYGANPSDARTEALAAYRNYTQGLRKALVEEKVRAASAAPGAAADLDDVPLGPTEPPQNPMQADIKGYRKFDQATSDFINDVKELGTVVESILRRAEELGASPRELALARTNLQQGAMWLIRSVAKPEGLF